MENKKVSKLLYHWTMQGKPEIFETEWIEYEVTSNIAVWDNMAKYYANKLNIKEDLSGYYYQGSEEYKEYEKYNPVIEELKKL